jgi:hypothetical protein
MRLSKVTALLALAAAFAEACSFFIPFDEYAGSGQSPPDAGLEGRAPDATAVSDSALDDGPVVVDDGSTPVTCSSSADVKSDPANCGACGRQCAGDGGCEAGRCPVEVVFDAAASILGLAAAPSDDPDAGDYLYFTLASGGLERVLADGVKDAEAMPTDAALGPVSLAGGGTLGAFATAKAIEAFKVGTFSSAAPIVVSTTESPATALMMVGSVAYWGTTDVFWKTAVASGKPSDAGAPPGVAFDYYGSTLYWVVDDGSVYRMSAVTPGAAAAAISPFGSGRMAQSFAVGKKTIVVGQGSQGISVFTLDATGHGTLSRTNSAPSDPLVMTTDAVHVYVVDANGGGRKGRLFRLLADGTEFITLDDTLVAAPAVVLSGDYVYYANGAQILRTTK